MAEPTETSALLPRPAPNPLPKLQLAIVMVIQICEPIASHTIYPYINQLVSELDITSGDARKVGYYAGLESLFFLTEALTILQWSRASDRIGRKPIFLIGLLGSAMSMLCFGLSRTFWALVISRCLSGMLNGNSGVMKSALADLTDSTNRARAVSYFPVVWAAGISLGPFIGGTLSRPHERFPTLFSGKFWKEFPYFLPTLVTGSFIFVAFLIVLAFFKESAPHLSAKKGPGVDDSLDATAPAESRKPRSVPLRELFIFPIIISVSNYVALAFLGIALEALLPLFMAMPIEIGGLGLPPPTIGIVLGVYGAASGIVQMTCFEPLVMRFGEKRVFMGGLSACLPLFALFPVTSVLAKASGSGQLSLGVWSGVGCMFALLSILEFSFGAIFMFVVASTPKHSRGATNGLAQTSASLARALGPALATSLFSFSVEYRILGGYAVYALFGGFGVGALLLGSRLPAEVWEEKD